MNGGRRGIAWPEMDSLLRDGVAAGVPDRDLLHRFVSDREGSGELAFTALVARHGPMVLGVCRRILRDPAEADDAFQATFLVLARKAGSIRLGESLGPWLHGVSRRVARRLRVVATRQRPASDDGFGLESLPDRRPSPEGDSLRRLDLDETLAALPDAFGAALRLCYLEGLTHEEAAARLGCPVGTVRSRLARGRALMRRRLEGPPASPVAPPLIETTARAAARFAAGRPMAGAVPARVSEVATGVIIAMSRIKWIAAVVIALGSLAGWGAWAGGPQQREADRPPSDRLRGDFDGPRAPKRLQPTFEKPEAKPARERPDDFPAFVVETVPKLGDIDVDPEKTKELRVTFSKPMMDRSWSWTSGNVYATPETTGPIHYLADRRTCVMPVKLEPGKTYVMGINGGRFNNFKSADGKPSLPSSIAFRTRAAK